MILLALDFSTNRRSAATARIENGRATILSEATEEVQRGGSPFPLIQQALGSLAPSEIETLAIGLGPGSYVGIRSALAVAQGWYLVHKIPACGISSAEAIAYEAWLQNLRGPVEVLIDAQRNEFYSQQFVLNDSGASETSALCILKAPATTDAIGPMSNPQSAIRNPELVAPTARALCHLAARPSTTFARPDQLQAIYLREATFVKAPPPRLIP